MNSEVDSFIIYMYGRIRYAQYGEWRKRKYTQVRRDYLRAHAYVSRCEDCRAILTKKRRQPGRPFINTYITIDHIVPLWVCKEYDLPELEFDTRNYRIICARCNSDRGSVEDRLERLALPDGMVSKIMEASGRWQKKRASLLAETAVVK